jgi:hypothetical protein
MILTICQPRQRLEDNQYYLLPSLEECQYHLLPNVWGIARKLSISFTAYRLEDCHYHVLPSLED